MMAANPARTRYYLMILAQMICVAGAVFGLFLIGRGETTLVQITGGAVTLAALYCMAVVPRALARRWRTPPTE